MIERSGLRTKPGWTPSPLPNFSLYPTATLTSFITIYEPRHKICTCMDPGIFAKVCVWRGGGSRSNCQKSALTMFFFNYLFVFLVLNLFCRGCPMVISKKTIIFQGFRGGQHFPEGVRLFQGGSKC